MPSIDAFLRVREVTYIRDDLPVFEPVTFELQVGEAVLIEGGNGVGKTTLLRQLAGLNALGEGDVHVGEQRLTDFLLTARDQMLYLGHRLGVKGDLSCVENLHLWGRLWGQARAANDALHYVGLTGFGDAPAKQLSAGQTKRLALARLILCPARLWLLDEPYSNLDLHGIALVNGMLKAHLDQGGVAVMTSHGVFDPGVPDIGRYRLEAA